MSPLSKLFDIIIEFDQLKNVYRNTRPVGLERTENSAEHSWHVALAALLLKDTANTEIDIFKVITMLLIHDLGEIYVGDVIIYESQNPKRKQEEFEAIKALFDRLPPETGNHFMMLWDEFENGQTPEALFARSVDRLLPLLQNIYGKQTSWDDHKISNEKVLAVNSKIKLGSTAIWEEVEPKLMAILGKRDLK